MMPTVSTVDRALQIALEVASYRPDYSARLARATKKLLSIGNIADAEQKGRPPVDRNFTISLLAYEALSQSYSVIKRADRRLAPRGRVAALTRRTLAMTAFAGSSTQPVFRKVFDDCCMAAELKFVHGLEYHRRGRRPNASHVSALVMHDVEGAPCAYQKAVGIPYAYVWRDSVLQTHAGPRSLLAGSIVKPLYNGGRRQPPPHEKFAGAGLVGVTGCVADDIEFKRFSLQLIPKAIRTAAFLDATVPGAYEEYRHHIDDTVALNDTAFANNIAELTKGAKDYFVAEIPAGRSNICSD